ncbi:MAG: hypothetical protein ACK4GN_10040 [Runella sp.]
MLRFSEAFYVSSIHYDGYKCGASPKLHLSIPKPRRGASFVEKNHPKNPPSLGEAQVL